MRASSFDLFDGVVPFVATSEARSFRAAAKQLAVTASAVSKAISRLEGELGVRLLHRTSRSVTLTVEGEMFLHRCRVAIDEVRTGRAAMHDIQRAPRGVLRISLPHRLGPLVMSKLPALLQGHPLLTVEASVTDRFVRLAEENIDVALRVGALASSTSIARRLRLLRRVTVASPAYLKRQGIPRTPEDLIRHSCLAFVLQSGISQEWSFRRNGVMLHTPIRGRLRADHGETIVAAATSGLGLMQAPDIMIAEELATRKLVEVLRDFAAPGLPLTALCVPGRQSSPKVRAYLKFLVDLFGKRNAECSPAHAIGEHE